MRFLFSQRYWSTKEDYYGEKADYERYGAVIRRYRDSKQRWNRAWFIDFATAREIAKWCRFHKREVVVQWPNSKDEARFLVFDPFHECE